MYLPSTTTFLTISLFLRSVLSLPISQVVLDPPHPQPHSLQPSSTSISNHHISIDHNPSSRHHPTSLDISGACAEPIRLLCQQSTSSTPTDHWIRHSNDECSVSHWIPSLVEDERAWSREDCEETGANMVKQLQEARGFVPECNRASVNVVRMGLEAGEEGEERLEAGNDGVPSMVLEI